MATLATISDHIIDICENAVRSNASVCELNIIENNEDFIFIIKDYGKGIKEEDLEKILDPFYTTKKERKKKFGVGLPFLKFSSELTGGSFKIESKINEGTTVTVVFKKNHIDCQPIGNLASAIFTIIYMNEKVEWHIRRFFIEECYEINTNELKLEYNDIFYSNKFMKYLKDTLYNMENNILK